MCASWLATKAGAQAFKLLTGWIPIGGNLVNGTVASGTTYAIGKGVIAACELFEKNGRNMKIFEEAIKHAQKGR